MSCVLYTVAVRRDPDMKKHMSAIACVVIALSSSGSAVTFSSNKWRNVK